MQHGFAKLSRGPDAFAAILQGMGVPDPNLMAWLTIITELLGGFAVALGAFVAIVSVPMTAVLLVAMFQVHLRYGFSSIKLLAVTATGAKFGPVGYEVILLYIAGLAALVIGGSGPFAIDGLISRGLGSAIRSRIPALAAESKGQCSDLSHTKRACRSIIKTPRFFSQTTRAYTPSNGDPEKIGNLKAVGGPSDMHHPLK